jgi:hypothetical protein
MRTCKPAHRPASEEGERYEKQLHSGRMISHGSIASILLFLSFLSFSCRFGRYGKVPYDLCKLQMACGFIRDTTRIPTRALTLVLDRGGITKGRGPRDGEVKTEKGREPSQFDSECMKNFRRCSSDGHLDVLEHAYEKGCLWDGMK